MAWNFGTIPLKVLAEICKMADFLIPAVEGKDTRVRAWTPAPGRGAGEGLVGVAARTARHVLLNFSALINSLTHSSVPPLLTVTFANEGLSRRRQIPRKRKCYAEGYKVLYRNNKFPILKVTTVSLALLPIFPMRIQVQKSLPTYLQSLGVTVPVNRTAGQGTKEHHIPKSERLPRLSLDLFLWSYCQNLYLPSTCPV